MIITNDQLVARFGTHGHTDTQCQTIIVWAILTCEKYDSQVGVHKSQFSATNISFNLSLSTKFLLQLKAQTKISRCFGTHII